MRILCQAAISRKNYVRKSFLHELDLVFFQKRHCSFDFQIMRWFQIINPDLNFWKDLVFNCILNLILDDYNIFENMFNCDYNVLGIAFCQLLNWCWINMFLFFDQTLKSFFVFHFLKVLWIITFLFIIWKTL
jgi:hypothetical protein